MLYPMSMPKSPRIVPGSASRPLVAPISLRATEIASFPCHAMQTTGPEVTNLMSPGKKRSLLVNIVMRSGDFFGRNHRFHTDKFQSFSFKSSKYFSDKSSLYAVGFNHHIGSLHGVHQTYPKVTCLRALLWGKREVVFPEGVHWIPPLT